MRSILVPSTLYIASLKRYTPKFSRPSQQLTWCQPFSVQVHPSQVTLILAHKINSWSNGQFLPIHTIHILKLLFQRLIWHIWGPSTCILWSLRFFVTLWDWTGSISRNLVVCFRHVVAGLFLWCCYACKTNPNQTIIHYQKVIENIK